MNHNGNTFEFQDASAVPQQVVKKPRTLAQRQLEKVDKKGMSALTSYFTKKKKKVAK